MARTTQKLAPATQLYKTSDETKRIAALVASEVCTWPKVTAKRMFGLNSLYRGGHIFAAVPDKRAFFTDHSMIFKLHRVDERLDLQLTNDPRVNRSGGIGKKWFGYELDSAADIHNAIHWLSEAYEQAKSRTAAPKPKAKKRST